MSHPIRTSNMTTRAINQLPAAGNHRLDTQHYGLRTEITEIPALAAPATQKHFDRG